MVAPLLGSADANRPTPWMGFAEEDPLRHTNPLLEMAVRQEGKAFSTEGSTGHSQYFDPDEDSLRNMAALTVGHYGLVDP